MESVKETKCSETLKGRGRTKRKNQKFHKYSKLECLTLKRKRDPRTRISQASGSKRSRNT